MYRIVKLSGKLMAVKFDEIYDEIDNIEDFIESGDVVILCSDLEDLDSLGINTNEIEIVS